MDSILEAFRIVGDACKSSMTSSSKKEGNANAQGSTTHTSSTDSASFLDELESIANSREDSDTKSSTDSASFLDELESIANSREDSDTSTSSAGYESYWDEVESGGVSKGADSDTSTSSAGYESYWDEVENSTSTTNESEGSDTLTSSAGCESYWDEVESGGIPKNNESVTDGNANPQSTEGTGSATPASVWDDIENGVYRNPANNAKGTDSDTPASSTDSVSFLDELESIADSTEGTGSTTSESVWDAIESGVYRNPANTTDEGMDTFASDIESMGSTTFTSDTDSESFFDELESLNSTTEEGNAEPQNTEGKVSAISVSDTDLEGFYNTPVSDRVEEVKEVKGSDVTLEGTGYGALCYDDFDLGEDIPDIDDLLDDTDDVNVSQYTEVQPLVSRVTLVMDIGKPVMYEMELASKTEGYADSNTVISSTRKLTSMRLKIIGEREQKLYQKLSIRGTDVTIRRDGVVYDIYTKGTAENEVFVLKKRR